MSFKWYSHYDSGKQHKINVDVVRYYQGHRYALGIPTLTTTRLYSKIKCILVLSSYFIAGISLERKASFLRSCVLESQKHNRFLFESGHTMPATFEYIDMSQVHLYLDFLKQ